MLINSSFLDIFPLAYYKVDSHSGSDHAPIILLANPVKKGASRFMFKEFWLSIDIFWDELLTAFDRPLAASPIASLYDSLAALKNAIKKKNWFSSNYLSYNIMLLKNQQALSLEQIQNDPLNPELNISLKNTNEQLALAHVAWSSWISQRAKAYWLSHGEDDLGFLFAKIRARTNKNLIKELATDTGILTSHAEISKALVDHFQSLFNAPAPPLQSSYNIPTGNTVPSTALAALIAPITNDEIKKVVFGGVASSTPGPDGYSFAFYQKTWLISGHRLCSAVKHFFSTGLMSRGAKSTVITLIPKGSHSSSISDYRPISLCNVFYKIVAKIIANRMKPILPLIINKSQSGFVAKRSSTDYIILASEILRDFRCSKGSFCAKLDVRKAFDSVSRSFLLHRLSQKGFPDIFVNWIKGCISDVHFSISVNGVLEGYFKSSSGLRQGCPLSPLLFCIAMDALSSSLDDNLGSHFIGISNRNCNLSHLMYADDLLVIGKATRDNALALKDILLYFSKASGLFINTAKSTLIFSKSVNASLVSTVAGCLGISNVAEVITYLGLPISATRLRMSHFQPLIDKIFGMLEGWKIKFLSFAGRVQFLKFTISNTIAYWIRGSIIPKACCKSISKMCAKFLFFGNVKDKKLHLISWNTVVSPKSKGGLGLPSFDVLYHNLACSFIFRMYNSDNILGLWFREKFCSPWKPYPPSASKFWKLCCLKAVEIKEHISLVPNSNSNFSFFWDPWCNKKALVELSCPHHFSNLMITDVMANNTWNLPLAIPEEIASTVMRIDLSSLPHCISWDGVASPNNKTFSKLFYSNLEDIGWAKFIWHKGYALRYASYSWMAMHRKLKTADLLILKGIPVVSSCSFCDATWENHAHLYFECDFTFSLLSALLPSLRNFYLRPNLHQVYDFLGSMRHFSSLELNFCYLTISVTVYWIWRERNGRKFASLTKNISELKEVITQAIRAKVINWKHYDSLKLHFQEILA
ncbi:Putative ribonuclease H protein [Dendrobium catenatum]|uniref:Ribonuclease H protein n=1 Tax=Dendrobium catenatum TaxID=906689 RepID=A0A2I0VBW4_9ASPA|nr:Putative ribonuclease H protein [Dendrobium catenatum]